MQLVKLVVHLGAKTAYRWWTYVHPMFRLVLTHGEQGVSKYNLALMQALMLDKQPNR